MNSFVDAATKQVEHQAVGGAKRIVKKSSKQDNKKQTQKSQDKKTQQKQQDRSDKKKQSAKKGGAIVDDVKNLAVPFAILLAKEGLSKMFPKSAKSSSQAKSSISPASASKSSSSRRRTTMSGGSCNLGCTAQTGGQAAKQLFELQTEIDRFLEKY